MHNKETIFSKSAFYMISFLIMIAPLMRGSVHPWAKTILQIIVLLAAIILLIENIIFNQSVQRISTIEKSVFSIFVLGLFSFMFSSYKPVAGESLFMLFIYLTTFLTCANSTRTKKQRQILAYLIVGTAVVLSVIGTLKRLDMLPIPWWQYLDIDLTTSAKDAVSGVYGSKNHMAGFLEMAIPFSILLVFIKRHSNGAVVVHLSIVLFLLIVQILTLSRGGWFSTAVSLIFLASVITGTKGRLKKMTVLVVGLCIIAISVFFISNLALVKRASTLTDSQEGLPISGRLNCWKGTIDQIKNNWLTGTGPGTFSQAYPQYQLPGYAYLEKYAHNDYLNFIAETGILFVPVTTVVLYLFFKRGVISLKNLSCQERGLAASAMAGILAVLIHSFGDFNLNIPANTFLFVILGAILVIIPKDAKLSG